MRQASLLYNPKNILYLWRTRQEGCISTSQGPMACVVWHTLLCLKGNQQQLPGKAQNTAWQLCAERWHSQSPSHTARPTAPWLGTRLAFVQPPPCEIYISRISLFPGPQEHTCSLWRTSGCPPWKETLQAVDEDPYRWAPISKCWLPLCSLYTGAKPDGERLLTPGQGKEQLQTLTVTSLTADEKRSHPHFSWSFFTSTSFSSYFPAAPL